MMNRGAYLRDVHLQEVVERRVLRVWRPLIILTSDHGEMLGDHGVFGSESYHDEACHIPLIIVDPRSAATGQWIDLFTESVDIMPTVLEWVGLPVGSNC